METQPENTPVPLSPGIESVSFEGIPSGDNDGFCWDVTRETFARVLKRQPGEFDGSYFNLGLFRLYPGALMPASDALSHTTYKFTLQVEPTKVVTPDSSNSVNEVDLGKASMPEFKAP